MKGAVPLLLLTACGGNFVDSSQRCEHDVFDWFGGLVQHLEQGDGFAFNYVPDQGHVSKVAGGYITNNPDTDFYWYTTYANGHYLQKSTTQGIGTAWTSGDLDVLLVEDVEDVLDDDWRMIRREERGGCKGRISEMSSSSDDLDWGDFQLALNSDAVVTEYTIISSDRVDYTRVYEPSKNENLERTGNWLSDHTGSYSETWKDGSSEGSSEG